MLHSQCDPSTGCDAAASPKTWDGYGSETNYSYRKPSSTSSPHFRVFFQDLTESLSTGMTLDSQNDGGRRVMDPIATGSGLNAPVLPTDLASAEVVDISIIDAAFGFQSAEERDRELPSDAVQRAGSGESWWIEGGGNIQLGALDMSLGARQPEEHTTACSFDLTSDLANPEGVSDRSISVWDYTKDDPLGSMATGMGSGDSEDLGPTSIGTSTVPECCSEPRSETFHFKLEEERGETQDLGNIMDWVPAHLTDHESLNNEGVCDPQSPNPTEDDDPAKDGELERQFEDALGNGGQQPNNFLSFPLGRETVFNCHNATEKESERVFLDGGDFKTSSVESLQTDEQRRSPIGNSTYSFSQSCVETEREHGLQDCVHPRISAQKGPDRSFKAKATQKPPTTVGISLGHLKEVFHLHRPEAERKLNLKRTTFSNLSRHFGISKWPFRTLRDADKRLKHNSMVLRKPSTSREKRRKLEVQQRRLRAVKDLMYSEPHQSKDSNTLAVLLTLVEQRERSAGESGSRRI